MSDSFEKIIEDSQLEPCVYSRKSGFGPFDATRCLDCMFAGPGSCDEKMRRDLVSRCQDAAAAWCVEAIL